MLFSADDDDALEGEDSGHAREKYDPIGEWAGSQAVLVAVGGAGSVGSSRNRCGGLGLLIKPGDGVGATDGRDRI